MDKPKRQARKQLDWLGRGDAERIRIIDYLFSSRNKVKVTSAGMLREMVNARVLEAKPVTSDIAIRKLITVIRDIAREDGVVISHPRFGYRYDREDYSVFEADNREEKYELDLLLFSASLFNKFKGSELFDDLQEIVGRIVKDNNKGIGLADRGVQRYLQVQTGTTIRGTRWIKPILAAIQQRKTLKMEYEGYGKEPKTKRICPYVLKEYMGRWYMVAHDLDCERIHKTNVFNLDCINDLRHAPDAYHQDPDFDAERYFRHSLGVWHQHLERPVKIRLEFAEEYDKDLLRHEPIHATQTIVSAGRNAPLVVEVEVFETPELYQLLLSYGARVKVLSPKRVAEELKSRLMESLRHYE